MPALAYGAALFPLQPLSSSCWVWQGVIVLQKTAVSDSAIVVGRECSSGLQRVLGIACGVLLLEITAILVFPRSATQVAVEKMGSALQKLAALNQMTWVQGPWQAPQAGAAEAPAKGSRSACPAGLSAALMHPTAVQHLKGEEQSLCITCKQHCQS